MNKKTLGFWNTLEKISGNAAVEAEWCVQIGSGYELSKIFLRPNGKLALSHPCKIPQGCSTEHDVIIHDQDDIVAVCSCEQGCENFPLQQSDIVVYELNRPFLETQLADAFGLLKESDTRTDIYRTTHIGNYSPNLGFRFPVYLTIQLEISDFDNVVDALLSRNERPFILLVPTHELCTAKTEKRLTDKNSSLVPLIDYVVFAEKQRLRLLCPVEHVLSQFLKANFPPDEDDISQIFYPMVHPANNVVDTYKNDSVSPNLSKEDMEGKIRLERKEVDDEVHWIVNSIDKGRFFLRATSKKAKIIEALYDQIEKGWVPHKTFMNGCGWKENEYYPAFDDPGCMQRQLRDIRKFLDVNIEFNKNKGVRFAENVVKSK